MSDENSFGSVATQEAPPTAVAPQEPAGRSTRAVLLAAGVGVLVLAVFAYLLFFKGGSTDESLGVVPQQPPASPQASAPADPATKPATTVPDSKDVTGRNPFKPLEVQATTAPTTGTGTDTTGTGTGTTTTPPPVAAETVTVTLVAVGTDTVKTTVGTKTYKGLAAGDTFATNFQVYAIFNDSCAGFLYGDTSFALCEGKSATLDKL